MSNNMVQVQSYPTVDSILTEPFESLVEMYYQLEGYITSSNKWFWVFESSKQQRGYQDIDVLAINNDETLIISVTINLDDKVRFGRNGKLREDMMENLISYFNRVKEYLKKVNKYNWLIKNERNVKRIIAYASGGYKNKERMKKLEKKLEEKEIELISSKEIIEYLKKKIKKIQDDGLKTNNQLVKMIQLWLKVECKNSA